MQVNAVANSDSPNPAYLWRDGKFTPWEQATIHVNAVGHASVAGIFEGIKAYRSAAGDALLVFRLREHLKRFVDSAKLSRIAMPHDVESLAAATVGLLVRNDVTVDTYIRPWCFAKGIIRQLIVPEGVPTETAIDCWPFTSSLGSDRGVKACISSWRKIDDQEMPPRVKAFSNYHNARFAALEATRAGYGGTILLGRDGKVTEGASSCVAMVRDGAIVTSPVSGSILESITRDTLLVLAREELGLPVLERPIDRSELHLATELFFMGTGWEILPIVTLDGLAVGDGTMGPVAKVLDASYTNLVRGRVADKRNWVTRVHIAQKRR
jgi:branched-chain amino acid aminotransferase